MAHSGIQPQQIKITTHVLDSKFLSLHEFIYQCISYFGRINETNLPSYLDETDRLLDQLVSHMDECKSLERTTLNLANSVLTGFCGFYFRAANATRFKQALNLQVFLFQKQAVEMPQDAIKHLLNFYKLVIQVTSTAYEVTDPSWNSHHPEREKIHSYVFDKLKELIEEISHNYLEETLIVLQQLFFFFEKAKNWELCLKILTVFLSESDKLTTRNVKLGAPYKLFGFATASQTYNSLKNFPASVKLMGEGVEWGRDLFKHRLLDAPLLKQIEDKHKALLDDLLMQCGNHIIEAKESKKTNVEIAGLLDILLLEIKKHELSKLELDSIILTLKEYILFCQSHNDWEHAIKYGQCCVQLCIPLIEKDKEAKDQGFPGFHHLAELQHLQSISLEQAGKLTEAIEWSDKSINNYTKLQKKLPSHLNLKQSNDKAITRHSELVKKQKGLAEEKESKKTNVKLKALQRIELGLKQDISRIHSVSISDDKIERAVSLIYAAQIATKEEKIDYKKIADLCNQALVECKPVPLFLAHFYRANAFVFSKDMSHEESKLALAETIKDAEILIEKFPAASGSLKMGSTRGHFLKAICLFLQDDNQQSKRLLLEGINLEKKQMEEGKKVPFNALAAKAFATLVLIESETISALEPFKVKKKKNEDHRTVQLNEVKKIHYDALKLQERGIQLKANGKIDGSKECFNQAIQLITKAIVIDTLTERKSNEGLALQQTNAEFFMYRGEIRAELGEYSSAFQDMDTAIWITSLQLAFYKKNKLDHLTSLWDTQIYELSRALERFKEGKKQAENKFTELEAKAQAKKLEKEQKQLHKMRKVAEQEIRRKEEESKKITLEMKQLKDAANTSFLDTKATPATLSQPLVSIQMDFKKLENLTNELNQLIKELNQLGVQVAPYAKEYKRISKILSVEPELTNLEKCNRIELSLAETELHHLNLLTETLPETHASVDQLRAQSQKLELHTKKINGSKILVSETTAILSKALTDSQVLISKANEALSQQKQLLLNSITQTQKIIQDINQEFKEAENHCLMVASDLDQFNSQEAEINQLMEDCVQINAEILKESKNLETLTGSEEKLPDENKEVDTSLIKLRERAVNEYKLACTQFDELLLAQIHANELGSSLGRTNILKERERIGSEVKVELSKVKKLKAKIDKRAISLPSSDPAKDLKAKALEKLNLIKEKIKAAEKSKETKAHWTKLRIALSVTTKFKLTGLEAKRRHDAKKEENAKQNLKPLELFEPLDVQSDTDSEFGHTPPVEPRAHQASPASSETSDSAAGSPSLRSISAADDSEIDTPPGVQKLELKEDKSLNEFKPYMLYTPAQEPFLIPVTQKASHTLTKLKQAGAKLAFGVGGLARDALLGRCSYRTYKDKLECDIDAVTEANSSFVCKTFDHTKPAYKPRDLGNGVVSVPDTNMYKFRDPKAIHDTIQIKHSPFFAKTADGNYFFADPLRTDFLSRDLTINGFYCDEIGQVFATSEALQALHKKEIVIVDKLEFLKIQAKAYNRIFDEKSYAGKTSEQIAYEMDSRIFLRGILAASYGDLHFSPSFVQSFPIGRSVLKNDLRNTLKVKQINTLLKDKVFRHTLDSATVRFNLLTHNGVNEILFPGLIESIAQHNLSRELTDVLRDEMNLDRIYAAFLVMQNYPFFLSLPPEKLSDNDYLKQTIGALLQHQPLIQTQYEVHLKTMQSGTPPFHSLVCEFTHRFRANAMMAAAKAKPITAPGNHNRMEKKGQGKSLAPHARFHAGAGAGSANRHQQRKGHGYNNGLRSG